MTKLPFKGGTSATPTFTQDKLVNRSNRMITATRLAMMNGASYARDERLANCNCGGAPAPEVVKNEDTASDAPVGTTDASQGSEMLENENFSFDNCVLSNEAKHGKDAATKICGEMKTKFTNSKESKEVIENAVKSAFAEHEATITNASKPTETLVNAATVPSNDYATIVNAIRAKRASVTNVTPVVAAKVENAAPAVTPNATNVTVEVVTNANVTKTDVVANVTDVYERAAEYITNSRPIPTELQTELDAAIANDFTATDKVTNGGPGSGPRPSGATQKEPATYAEAIGRQAHKATAKHEGHSAGVNGMPSKEHLEERIRLSDHAGKLHGLASEAYEKYDKNPEKAAEHAKLRDAHANWSGADRELTKIAS